MVVADNRGERMAAAMGFVNYNNVTIVGTTMSSKSFAPH